MYLFLYFPTDILAGIIFGTLMVIIATKLVEIISKVLNIFIILKGVDVGVIE